MRYLPEYQTNASNVNAANSQSDDFLTRLLRLGLDLNLKSIQSAVDDYIPILEKLMGKKLNEHIGFYGNLSSYGELEVKFSDRMERYGWREGS